MSSSSTSSLSLSLSFDLDDFPDDKDWPITKRVKDWVYETEKYEKSLKRGEASALSDKPCVLPILNDNDNDSAIQHLTLQNQIDDKNVNILSGINKLPRYSEQKVSTHTWKSFIPSKLEIINNKRISKRNIWKANPGKLLSSYKKRGRLASNKHEYERVTNGSTINNAVFHYNPVKPDKKKYNCLDNLYKNNSFMRIQNNPFYYEPNDTLLRKSNRDSYLNTSNIEIHQTCPSSAGSSSFLQNFNVADTSLYSSLNKKHKRLETHKQFKSQKNGENRNNNIQKRKIYNKLPQVVINERTLVSHSADSADTKIPASASASASASALVHLNETPESMPGLGLPGLDIHMHAGSIINEELKQIDVTHNIQEDTDNTDPSSKSNAVSRETEFLLVNKKQENQHQYVRACGRYCYHVIIVVLTGIFLKFAHSYYYISDLD